MKSGIVFIFLMSLTFYSSAQAIKKKKQTGDSLQIRNTIMGFYEWYNTNYSKLNAFNLYTITTTKKGPPYKINWKDAERYFAYIRKSVPQLGEEFIKSEQHFFRECDSFYKAEPDEEIVYGFDFDRFTQSQEDPEWLLVELRKSNIWKIKTNGINANVEIMSYYDDNGEKIEWRVLCLKMKKEKMKWKIAQIGCTFDKDEQ